MRLSALAFLAVLSSASAWAPSPFNGVPRSAAQRQSVQRGTALRMAIDYTDPVVAEEFNKVQPMTFEEVEEELMEKGIRPPPTMNEMDVKLMLVEMRLRYAGKIGNEKKEQKQKPTKFSTKFEEALWTKPAFEELYQELKTKDDYNSMNVAAEYLNDPENAKSRYSKTYTKLLRDIDEALNAPPPVKTPTIQFSGFPANMGEAGLKMTLEALGAITEIECEQDEDFPILKGKVTFEDIESAKKAVEQYNGMDMGMGSALELVSV